MAKNIGVMRVFGRALLSRKNCHFCFNVKKSHFRRNALQMRFERATIFLCAAGAVEKFATDGTVSVVYLRDSIGISKINAAFLTGQQIDRIHVQQLLLPSFMCQGAQCLLLYHVPSPKTIAFLTKDTHKNFPP